MKMELRGCERLDRQETVLERGKAGEEVRDLVGARQAEAGAPVWRVAGDVPPEERDPAVGRTGLAADQAEQCGLARAVGTNDRPALAGTDRQAHAVDRAKAAELLREPAETQRDGTLRHAPRLVPMGSVRHQQYLHAGKLRSYT